MLQVAARTGVSQAEAPAAPVACRYARRPSGRKPYWTSGNGLELIRIAFINNGGNAAATARSLSCCYTTVLRAIGILHSRKVDIPALRHGRRCGAGTLSARDQLALRNGSSVEVDRSQCPLALAYGWHQHNGAYGSEPPHRSFAGPELRR
jgi:hypothetical protein